MGRDNGPIAFFIAQGPGGGVQGERVYCGTILHNRGPGRRPVTGSASLSLGVITRQVGRVVIRDRGEKEREREVVSNGPFKFFFFFLLALRKHKKTEINCKKKSGDVNDEVNFPFFILLHKRAKPILPPLPPRTNSNPIPPPSPSAPSPPRALSLWLNRVKESERLLAPASNSTNPLLPLTSIPKPSPSAHPSALLKELNMQN